MEFTELSKDPDDSEPVRQIYYQCPDDDKEYIILVKVRSRDWIFFYDIRNDEFIKKFEYPKTLLSLPMDNGGYQRLIQLDHGSGQLYIHTLSIMNSIYAKQDNIIHTLYHLLLISLNAADIIHVGVIQDFVMISNWN